MRHVVCISNNLKQTSPFQQKMVFLLLAVFKTKGAFHLSALAGRTIARPVSLIMKYAFSEMFC